MSDDKKEEAKKPAAAKPAAPPPGGKGPPPEPAIKLPKAPDGLMTLRVNGNDHFIDPKKYRSLIEVLNELKYDIPHFCYHPGLSTDGNCRMCYVNLVDVRSGKPMMGPNLATQPWEMRPKPIVSCRTPLDPRGMVVLTETQDILDARKWVMEFMLINHPLDCPVCDKAGECTLQNNSYEHGQADSRFAEAKNELAPKDLGDSIKLWTDRCITCRRCTRFLDEVSGTGELSIIERGDRSEIAIMPGHPVDNPLSGNIVDICPVGALIDKDLMFSYRAWYLQKTDTICADCSKGCNIQVQAQKQYVRRLVPRENEDVNGWWMCDRGREDFRYINSDKRVMQGKMNGETLPVVAASEEAGKMLAEFAATDPKSVVGLASAWLTVEELDQFKALFNDVLKSDRMGLMAEADGEEKVFPKFKIEADNNPNRAGAKLVLGADAEKKAAEYIEAMKNGEVKAVYLISGMPHFEPSGELLKALENVELVVVQELHHGALSTKAKILLPASTFAEKDGVFINSTGRAQVLRRAIDPLAQGNDDLTIIQRVTKAAGGTGKLLSAREVFRKMAETYPALADMSHKSLGRKGQPLNTISQEG